MKKLSVFLVVVLGFFVVNANALMIEGHDYEIFTGADPYAEIQPLYDPGYDLGYFLWANDASLTSWSLRWSGDTQDNTGADYIFSGNVVLSTNSLDVELFSWDTNDNAWIYPAAVDYVAYANVGQDGFDFTIIGDEMPSFIGFDLNVRTAPGTSTTSTAIGDQSNLVFVGADLVNPESGDFAIAAPSPVPEPATVLLVATGLIGLVGFRKKFKK
jgi:hypothetical protein